MEETASGDETFHAREVAQYETDMLGVVCCKKTATPLAGCC